MADLTSVTTLALLWVPVHLYLTQMDLIELKRWAGAILQPPARDVLKEQRVEEEMAKLRQWNYKLFSRFFSHLSFFSMYGFSYDAFALRELDSIFWAGGCIASYVQHLLIGQELLSMTPQRLKLFSGYHHLVTLLLSTITGMSASPLKFAVTRRFDFDGTRLSGRCDPRPCPPRSCAVWTYRPTGASTGSPVYMGKPCAIRVVYNLSFRETRSRETWVMYGLNTSIRFLLVLTFLDPWVSIPFQFLYTAVDLFVYVFVLEGTSAGMQVGPLCFGPFFICLLSIAASILIDSVLRARIYALLDTADAESLVSSFRRVLRGVCDGEVLLDSHMNVAKESECLKHLILTNVSLTGSSFLDLLADGEQHRFKAFIDSSTAAFGAQSQSTDATRWTHTAAPPLCLRVSLRGSEGVRVAADLYHVPVPGQADSEPSHLIAFKEDPELRARVPEAAEGAVPAALTEYRSSDGQNLRKSTSPMAQGDATSVRSGSTSRSSSAQAFLDLQEMFLLVDVDTELQDVQQVELNFKRQEEPLDVPSGLHSGMPSLRKLVKPMDWEKVRSKVSKFVEKSMRGDVEVQGKSMNPMTVQLPGHSGWLVVEEASLHPSQDAKVWLHLQGFRPEKARLLPSLGGIQESSRDP
ncbi:unnamed protein product [Durusdinium trenchii]|uniref:Uncharacterized protein n=1 Tax=Durusdinium trenchii TaxID=1381693 RepID=A0ABP0N1R8_9DINO